jgi:hypothetical protein
MWLFTRYGFYSIACARKPDNSIDQDLLMIRVRRRDHLESLQQRFPALAGSEIVTLPNRDYRYRIIVRKGMWVGIVTELAQEQDWSNFKNEVARHQGARGLDYVDALHEVWRVMLALQRGDVGMGYTPSQDLGEDKVARIPPGWDTGDGPWPGLRKHLKEQAKLKKLKPDSKQRKK